MSGTEIHTEAFVFRIAIEGMPDGFPVQEVSGLGNEADVDTVVEGGENRFVHQLPKAAKHPAVLKRFVLPASGPVMTWIRNVLEGDLSNPIEPKTMTIELLDMNDVAVRTWALTNAYPVKWSVSALDATKVDVAIDSLELAYATLKRA